MKRFIWAAALTLVGCNNVGTGLVVLGAAAPTDMMKCDYTAQGNAYLYAITFDVTRQDTLHLNLRVRNNLTVQTTNWGPDSRHDDVIAPNSVMPRRMEIRWECDSNGFSANLGPLYLPQFSATQPFCSNRSTRDFQGFDVIPATGQAIDAGGNLGLVSIRPITPQLGGALNDMFTLAQRAQACCTEAGGCMTDADLQRAASGPACTALQALFDTIAGTGQLRNTRASDLQKFIPYQAFDLRGGTRKPGTTVGPSYPLRLRGVLEGVTGSGSVVTSAEYDETIGICAECLATPPSCLSY